MDRLRTTSLTAIAPAVWGTTYIVTTELLPSGHPLFASLVRALPAGLLAMMLTRALPTGAWWWKAAVLGVLNVGAFFPLLFVAAYHLPGGVAATLGAAQPLVVAILVVVVLREPFSAWRLSWGIVGIVGVALVVLRSSATLDAVGVVAGLLGAVSMGFGVTLTKKWGRPTGVPAMGMAGWQLTAGGLVLLPVTLLFEGVPTTIDVAALAGYAWLGLVGGLLTYTLWFSGIGRLPVASVAVLGLLSPLVAATVGALLLGQNLGAVQMIGFALALTAIAAGQITPSRTPPNTATATQTRDHPLHRPEVVRLLRKNLDGKLTPSPTTSVQPHARMARCPLDRRRVCVLSVVRRVGTGDQGVARWRSPPRSTGPSTRVTWSRDVSSCTTCETTSG